MPDARKPALLFILITLFLDILGIGLIIPILPKLIEQMAGGDLGRASHHFGLLAALYSLMQFVFAPVLGSLSDHFGRRAVILPSLLGSALDYLLLAFAPGLTWFYVGRIIAGITGANLTAASAYIADVSSPEKRAQNFGMIGAAFGLGFIAGPALGGMLGNVGLRIPFLVAAGLTFLNLLYGFLVLPESLDPRHRRPFSWGRANPIASLAALRGFPRVGGLAVCFFLMQLSNYSLHSVWVLYTGYRYQWTTAQTGLSLAVVGVMAAVVQGGLVRRIVPWLGEPKSMVFGLLLSAVGMVSYGLATQGWMVYVILVFASLSGVARPAAQGLISRNVPPNEQGAVQGALSSLESVSGIIGPPMATTLFSFFVGPTAPVHLPGAPFFLATMFILAAAAVAAWIFKQHQVRI